jgi:hypothetical protein
MDQNKAIQVLVEVALVAQAKGVLSLEDAVVVKEAIDAFKLPEGQSGEMSVVDDNQED